MLVTLKAGGSSGKRAHAAPAEEFALVLSGAMELTIDGIEQVLNEGDAVTIRAGTRRRLAQRNSGTSPNNPGDSSLAG